MTVSLAFYTDSGLTSAADPLPITHYTDGSNDPQQFRLYLGSTATSKQFQASSDPGTDQIAISIANLTAAWTASTAVTLNEYRRPVTNNGYRYQCTTAGTTHSAEPTWPTTIGNTVSDGTAVWTCVSKLHVPTEVKLASTQGGLSSATPGASLNVGTQILSGTLNAVSVWLEVDDSTAVVATATELQLQTNDLTETSA